MLALATGWTEDTITCGITDRFRRACHHALYASALQEVRQSHEDALAVNDKGQPATLRAAMGAAKLQSRAAIDAVNAILYPDDDDG